MADTVSNRTSEFRNGVAAARVLFSPRFAFFHREGRASDEPRTPRAPHADGGPARGRPCPPGSSSAARHCRATSPPCLSRSSARSGPRHRPTPPGPIDPKGNGILDVRHSSGTGGVRLDVSDAGTGNVKIHSLDYDIRAQLGVKEGNKGDVCVMGNKGLDCLSFAFAKLLIPW